LPDARTRAERDPRRGELIFNRDAASGRCKGRCQRLERNGLLAVFSRRFHIGEALLELTAEHLVAIHYRPIARPQIFLPNMLHDTMVGHPC
jgi:hypothetical protein